MTDSDKSLVQLVRDYGRLQRLLFGKLVEQLAPMDPLRLSGEDRRGSIQIGNQAWEYARHGAGIMFTGPVVVDAHVGLPDFDDGADAWRLGQYVESLGWDAVQFRDEWIPADDELRMRQALESLASSGVLLRVVTSDGNVLFRPVEADNSEV